jgi:DNA-binding protein H-NS
MKAFGITAKDLTAPAKKGAGRSKTSVAGKTKTVKASKSTKGPKSGAKAAVKFKGPNGEAWTGRGLTPKWLASLVAQDRSNEEFAVQAEQPDADQS